MTKSPRGAAPKSPQRQVPVDPPAPIVLMRPQAEPSPTHPQQNLEREARASLPRLSVGISPHFFIEAWVDWVQDMSQAPSRQLELDERAQHKALTLLAHFAGTKGYATPDWLTGKSSGILASPEALGAPDRGLPPIEEAPGSCLFHR